MPFFGICFGNQLLGRALGFGTYKLPFGHRGINQPVHRPHAPARSRSPRTTTASPSTPRSTATSRRPYGFGRVEVSHVGLNDDVVEGLRRASTSRRFSVQYHPEAAAGPHDANYLFDRFGDLHRQQHEGRSLMPKRDDIKSVLVIGSGPIVIGQACEFDYSGTQACRVLREEGVRVILVNSNPATIMTDPDFADATYIEPITPEVVETIIAKERPDAMLADPRRPDRAQRGDRAARARHPREVRRRADRRQRRGDPARARTARSSRSVVAALRRRVGPQRTSRTRWTSASRPPTTSATRSSCGPSFTMGGLGSGFAYDEAELRRMAGAGLHH